LAKRNRRIACSEARQKTIGLPSSGLECDEYPFASTLQGGYDTTIAPVPAWENSGTGARIGGITRPSQKTILSSFYLRNFGRGSFANIAGDPAYEFNVLVVQ